MDILKQCISGRTNVVGHRIGGNWNVLRTARGATRLAEIIRQPRPKHICFAFYRSLDPGFQLLIIAHRNSGLKLLQRHPWLQAVIPTEGRCLAFLEQLLEQSLLTRLRIPCFFGFPRNGNARDGTAQEGLQTHDANLQFARSASQKKGRSYDRPFQIVCAGLT